MFYYHYILIYVFFISKTKKTTYLYGINIKGTTHMYVIVKEKTNNHVILVWECDNFELSDSHLMVQGADGMKIFNEYNNIEYVAEYYDGELMEGFDPTMYSFEFGQFTQLP